MDYSNLVDQLTPEIIADFCHAVEVGKWKDGQLLTPEQKEQCMQAIILFNARHTDNDGPFTVSSSGELRTGKEMRSEFKGKTANSDPDLIIQSKTLKD